MPLGLPILPPTPITGPTLPIRTLESTMPTTLPVTVITDRARRQADEAATGTIYQVLGTTWTDLWDIWNTID